MPSTTTNVPTVDVMWTRTVIVWKLTTVHIHHVIARHVGIDHVTCLADME